MSKLPCDLINDLLPLYIDGVCSEESCQAVTEHLKECENCTKEYEKLKTKTPSFAMDESKPLLKISKQWKKAKMKAFLSGLAAIIFIYATGLSVYLYATEEIPVSCEDITISNLCELSDGKIFFTLKASDSVCVEDIDWSQTWPWVFISFKTKRTQLFASHKYNSQNVSNWVFNVKDSGIRNIYYEGENRYDKPIWDADADTALKKASEYPQVWKKINKVYGNVSTADKLPFNLFANKAKYIGVPPVKLLQSMGIDFRLGAYTTQLHTVNQPYGITLHFKNPVDKDDRKEFDGWMSSYSYVLLALIDNCGYVTWTYPENENKEIPQITKYVDLADAKKFLGKDVKTYAESAETVQELLSKLEYRLTENLYTYKSP